MNDQIKSEAALRSCILSIGEIAVEVGGEGEADVTLAPALAPFQFATGAPDIRIRVEWVASLRQDSGHRIFDSGAVWRMYEGEGGFVFDFSASTLGEAPYKRLVVDRNFRHAVLQMNEECFAGGKHLACPLEYPLDELLIMHRLTQERAIELHGCGIVRADGIGNLFVGHSGAGKSTTTRLWTEREDVEVLSDDRIIVRRDEGTCVAETPREAGGGTRKHGVLRLRDSSALRSNHFAQDDRTGVAASEKQVPPRRFATGRNDIADVVRKGKTGIRMYGTPWHGEAMYASPNSAPLARIFVLEHGHGNVLTQLSRSQAVAELFARSFVPFHRHEYVESALDFLEEVAQAVPVYRYAFEPDQRAIETIINLRD